MVEILILVLAVVALFSIALEDVLHFNKAKSTLFIGCLSWFILFVAAKSQGSTEHIQEMLSENLLDIASLWLFLMSTMTFVAYLNAHGLVEELVQRVLPKALTLRQLTFLLAAFGCLLSMICDNITATLVGLGVVQAFQLTREERIRLSVLIVFAVNSGGVILITGDVTTLMIFSAGHVSIVELLKLALPAVVGVGLLAILMSASKSRQIVTQPVSHNIGWLDITIGIVFISTILLTLTFNLLFSIPPVLTFLLGLSVMFMIGGIAHTYNDQIHLLEYVRKIQFDTLLFFLGILLMVGALKEIGVLVWFAELYTTISPSIASFGIGMMSSLLDNVPLTAALLKSEPHLNGQQWLGLTYAVGVGGSLLVIGSAAGIVAMSRMRELTFLQYARFLPHLLASYSAGYACTLLL